MNIKEASDKTGISKDMIRFYEKKGLISPDRYSNDYRNYSDRDIFQLVTIKLYSELGISLDQICELMKKKDPDLFLEKLDAIETQLKEEEMVLEQRLELNSYLKSLFQMYKDGIAFKVSVSQPFYYYQREDAKEYASLSAYQCARPILRIKLKDLWSDNYEPYDQGKMFLKRVSHTLQCDHYGKHTYYQVIRFIEAHTKIDGSIIHPILKEMEHNGYQADGDLFLSQIFGNSTVEDEKDMICISIGCKDDNPARRQPIST